MVLRDSIGLMTEEKMQYEGAGSRKYEKNNKQKEDKKRNTMGPGNLVSTSLLVSYPISTFSCISSS